MDLKQHILSFLVAVALFFFSTASEATPTEIPQTSQPTKANQTITFGALTPKTYGDAGFNLFAETNSGLKVSFTSSNPNVAIVAENKVIVVGAGATTITAIQEGTNNFNAAKPVTQSLVIDRKQVNVENAIALTKNYDGKTNTIIQGATLTGVINSDEVFIENETIGDFNQANVGKGIPVSTAMALSGSKAGNYKLVQPVGLVADILKKEISVFAMNASKDCSDPDPILNFYYSPELVGWDSFIGELTREPGDEPGTRKVLLGTLALSNNYSLNYQGALLTIYDNAPVWVTMPSALNRVVEFNDAAGLAAAQALVPKAFDACDRNLPNPVKSIGLSVKNPDCDHIGSYTNTWTVTDQSGNVSDVYTQIITLIDRYIPVVENLQSIVVNVAPDVSETRVNYPEKKFLMLVSQ